MVGEMTKTAWVRAIGMLAIALLGLWFQSYYVKPFPVAADSRNYAAIADGILATGRFSDGVWSDAPPPERPSGMHIAPLYPGFVALVAAIDPALRSTIACASASATLANIGCPSDLGSLASIQLAIAVFTLLLLWWAALRVTGSESVAWGALAIASFGSYEYVGFARGILTENLVCPLFLGYSICQYLALKRARLHLAIAAGVLLGLTALTRPSFLYLGYVTALLGLILLALGPAWRKAGVICLAIGLVASLTVLPWMLRNLVVLGAFDLSRGYSGVILSERVSYDAMTWREYLAGWIYFLPDFGDTLARRLFDAADFVRLGWDDKPTSFYSVAHAELGPQSLIAAGGAAHQVGYLISHYVLPDLPKYSAVTLLLMWRGLWVSKYFGLFCTPMLVGRLIGDLRRRHYDLALFAAPSIFMLGLHAALSVNIARYNVGLIPAMSMAAALVLSRVRRLQSPLRPGGRRGWVRWGVSDGGLGPHQSQRPTSPDLSPLKGGEEKE
jgi:hypothetical protein